MAFLDLNKSFKTGGLLLNYNPNVYNKTGTNALPQGPGYGYYGAKDVYGAPSILGSSDSSVRPSTSGQAPSGSSSAISLSPPAIANTSNEDQSQLNTLRGQYDNSANDIRNQGVGLDTSYNQAKGDIQAAIDDSTNAANTQKAGVDKQFGDILKRQLQTYQDLNRQRQGTFSSLGTLDSSAYGEQQFRADQALADQKSETDLQKVSTVKSIDDSLGTFKKQGMSQLSQLAMQYQQGKNAIASALANNDLQGAAAIQSALSQIKQRAADVQNQILNFANQAQLLKAQGVNVNSSIAGTNGNAYGDAVLKQLQNLTSAGNTQYSVPASTVQGQGYISPQGKRYGSYAEYLASLRA